MHETKTGAWCANACFFDRFFWGARSSQKKMHETNTGTWWTHTAAPHWLQQRRGVRRARGPGKGLTMNLISCSVAWSPISSHTILNSFASIWPLHQGQPAFRASGIQFLWQFSGSGLFRLLGVWIVEPAVLIEHLKCGAKYELLFLRHFVLPCQPTSVKQ